MIATVTYVSIRSLNWSSIKQLVPNCHSPFAVLCSAYTHLQLFQPGLYRSPYILIDAHVSNWQIMSCKWSIHLAPCGKMAWHSVWLSLTAHIWCWVCCTGFGTELWAEDHCHLTWLLTVGLFIWNSAYDGKWHPESVRSRASTVCISHSETEFSEWVAAGPYNGTKESFGVASDTQHAIHVLIQGVDASCIPDYSTLKSCHPQALSIFNECKSLELLGHKWSLPSICWFWHALAQFSGPRFVVVIKQSSVIMCQ